jgi:hypothetical protein
MIIKGEDIISIEEIEVDYEENYLNYLKIKLKSGDVINYVPRAAHGYDSWLSIEANKTK